MAEHSISASRRQQCTGDTTWQTSCGSSTLHSITRPTGPGRHRSRSGWTMSPDDRGNGPHVCTFALRLHQNSGESVNEDAGRNDGYSSIGEIYGDICTDQMGYLHHLPGTESPVAGVSTSSPGVCEICAGANIPGIREENRPILEQPVSGTHSRCKVGCKGVQTSVNV